MGLTCESSKKDEEEEEVPLWLMWYTGAINAPHRLAFLTLHSLPTGPY